MDNLPVHYAVTAKSLIESVGADIVIYYAVFRPTLRNVYKNKMPTWLTED